MSKKLTWDEVRNVKGIYKRNTGRSYIIITETYGEIRYALWCNDSDCNGLQPAADYSHDLFTKVDGSLKINIVGGEHDAGEHDAGEHDDPAQPPTPPDENSDTYISDVITFEAKYRKWYQSRVSEQRKLEIRHAG